MAESRRAVVSLKQAIWEGVLLDFLLFFSSGTIMGGVITGVMLFIVVTHWIFNATILISPKVRNSRAGKDFIRFGIFPLMLVTFVIRGILIFLGVDFLV